MSKSLKALKALNVLLDELEDELPGLMVLYPDADGAEFWMAFSERSTRIEAQAGPTRVAHVRARLDRMLVSRGLLDDPNSPSGADAEPVPPVAVAS